MDAALAAERSRRFAAAHARLRVLAVTGTNGKTSTTSMIASIVDASGEPSAWLTTLGGYVCGERIVAATPEEEFLATVERAVAAGTRTLALEMTSKALVYGLAARFRPHVAIFTNLTEDHLEAHGGPEAYLAAKAQLFLALPPDGIAVLNADDPASALLDEVIAPSVRRARYAARGGAGELCAEGVHVSLAGTRVELSDGALARALGGSLTTGAIGRVHAENALAAALATSLAGYPPEAVQTGLARYRGVAGRFEVVAREPTVVVDYAHTPDGLSGTLETARELTRPGARLHVVFGCGGGRDRAKRPTMGGIAARLADAVTLTTDNPRHESPDAIAAAIRSGMATASAEVREEPDRRTAIRDAIVRAAPDDVVVIAGKGHETTQELAQGAVTFSDHDEAREAVRLRGVRTRP